jgi:hypothetical protein
MLELWIQNLQKGSRSCGQEPKGRLTTANTALPLESDDWVYGQTASLGKRRLQICEGSLSGRGHPPERPESWSGWYPKEVP